MKKQMEMPKMLKYYFKTVYPLVVIAVSVGLILGVVYQLIEPKLIERMKKEERDALQTLMPDAADFVPRTNDVVYFIAKNSGGRTSGYIFKVSHKGYGGPVVSLVSITNNAVASIAMLSMDQETPGLGTKTAEYSWYSQFYGLRSDQIPSSKAGFSQNNLDAVTGATLTSMAVVDNIRQAFDVYRKIK